MNQIFHSWHVQIIVFVHMISCLLAWIPKQLTTKMSRMTTAKGKVTGLAVNRLHCAGNTMWTPRHWGDRHVGRVRQHRDTFS